MKLPITKKRFKTWLRENPDLLFQRGDSHECPLAIFLGSGCDHRVAVDSGHCIVDDKEFLTPLWATLFIRKFDRSRKIASAKTALDLL